MIAWYDRQGKLIPGTQLPASNPRWIRAMHRVDSLLQDDEYKIVARTELPDDTLISTIWLGLDHGTGTSKRPVIFETMVFLPSGKTMMMKRYSTEKEAKRGHLAMVRQMRKNLE